MKQKEIEKIPYITLKKRSRKKDVKYIGMVMIKNIAHERNIILEVYLNEKGQQDVPLIRYAATKKDWAVYYPDQRVWRKQRINRNDYYDTPCWYDKNSITNDKSILNDEADLRKIQNFFKEISIWRQEEWWDYFGRNENKIKAAKSSRRYELRKGRLTQRIKETPELPKKEILNWADKRIFRKKHFLYYKKKGRYATICCSKCGGVSKTAFKDGMSYESMFEKKVEEPVDNHSGHCPLCKAYGLFKPQGKVKGSITETYYAFTASKYKDNGAIIRYLELSKEWQLELIGTDTGDEMNGAYEKVTGIEIARTYIEPDKEPQTDYHKHSYYSGKDFWDDCNMGFTKNIQIQSGILYPEMLNELQGTCLQYSGIEQYTVAAGSVDAIEYMKRYITFPQIEMLSKFGLIKVVEKMIKGYCGLVRNSKAKTVHEFLGIKKEHVKDLILHQGETKMLEAMRQEKRLEASWSKKQLEFITETIDHYNELEIALRYMSLEQFINRVEKYAGTKFEEFSCAGAIETIRHSATEYLDYLEMRIQLGYDLNNSIYAYPRDLNAEHHKMVLESSKKEEDNRIKEVEERYPLIKKKYRSLRKKYLYEDENYIIRPARSAAEIILEGRVLHHCVGGDTYLSRHNDGTSTILMLRHMKDPDVQYITIEIKKETIAQWYGAYDKKPDKEIISKLLEKYEETIKGQRNEKREKIEVIIPAMQMAM